VFIDYFTEEMIKERPDLKKYKGQKLTVIAWIWARTVKSPNPALRMWMCRWRVRLCCPRNRGKEAYVEPVVEGTVTTLR
jgi:putative DNA methylase